MAERLSVLVQFRRDAGDFEDYLARVLEYLKDRGGEWDLAVYAAGAGVTGAAEFPGLTAALEGLRAPVVALLGGDGGIPPKEIGVLLPRLTEGIDAVCGSRFMKGAIVQRRRDADAYRIKEKLRAHWGAFCAGQRLSDPSSGLAVFRTEALRKAAGAAKAPDFTGLLIAAAKSGLRVAEAPVMWNPTLPAPGRRA